MIFLSSRGQGETEEELHASVKSFPLEFIQPHITRDKTFKVRVETFNKTLKNAEKLKKIEVSDASSLIYSFTEKLSPIHWKKLYCLVVSSVMFFMLLLLAWVFVFKGTRACMGAYLCICMLCVCVCVHFYTYTILFSIENVLELLPKLKMNL